MKLEVWDSPNSAGVVIDAIRCCKLGLDNGLSGALIAPSAYFKKSPPVQYPDDVARQMVEQFIAEYGWKQKTTAVRPGVRAAAKDRKTARPATGARPAGGGKKPAAAAPKRIIRKKK